MEQSREAQLKKNNTFASKHVILLVVFAFVAACTVAIYFYVHQLENAF